MENKKKVSMLTLDGGGIRGIIPATVLQYVEEYLQQKAPNTTLADHFDFIAGTSTGGILTAIYLAPEDKKPDKAKFSAQEALDFYVKEGANIFNKAKLNNWQRLWGLRNATKFSPKNIERLLKDKFGDLVMSKLRKPCLITTYNMNSKSSYFFTSTEDKSKREFYVRDVLRSTSAAPTYFPPATIKNIAPNSQADTVNTEMINLDGGVFANNPTMCAYAEARNTEFKARNNLKPTASYMYILSLGTGGGGFTIENKEKSKHWSLLKWAKTIPEIMMDGSIDTVAYQMNEIRATLPPDVPGEYLRIDTPKKDRQYSSDMSNADEENIHKLLIAGQKTLDRAKLNGLNQFLDGLLED